MYAIVEDLLAKLDSDSSEKIEFTQDDIRLASAVLLYRAIQVDGRIRDVEVILYRKILEDHLDVSPDELLLFESMVEDQTKANNTIQPFISVVRKMPYKNKRKILDFMRDISLSDQEFHEFEVNLLARTAELLDIEP